MLRSRLRWTILVAAALLNHGTPAYGAPDPIVFDFEDGLQGWTLEGSTQRVQTHLLSGQWAIFGDGSAEEAAFISIETDLTNIASISVEQFFIAGDENGLLFFEAIQTIHFSVPFDVVEPGNPSTRTVDVSFLTGVRPQIGVSWWSIRLQEHPGPIVGFIDNITFHPVPEPGTLVLFGSALVGLAGLRRCR